MEGLMDARVQQMADILVRYSIEAKPGDWVVIESPIPGEPLADACVRAVLEAGGHPTVLFSSDDVTETRYRNGSDEQLRFLSVLERDVVEQADARISILAPRNSRTLSSVDPERIALGRAARQSLQERWMARSAEGTFNWNICAYPTPAAAQDANMSLREYADFVFGAALLNEPDPIAAWKALGERQSRLVEWITPRKEIEIHGPGTELRLSVDGRTWMNDSGHKNFPGGEIFTSPVEDSVEGQIEFTFPAFLSGREVTGVRLVFEKGVVTEATAQGDDAFLQEMLNLDEGARRLGEFAFGTNGGIRRFTKNTLFDEKMGGTVHMALGAGFPDAGSVNTSALHWDMVYDLRRGSEVLVDGELFSRNGEFQVLREALAGR
jgi:aminopeptidase